MLVMFGFLTPVAVFAAGPSLPHQFFGLVSFSSGAAPDGLAVSAKINGNAIGNSITSGGNYGYSPNLLFVTDADGINAGETVEFYVGGIKANETHVFANGGSNNLNLTVPGSVGTLSQSATDVITNQSIAITPTSPTVVQMGSSATITVSSDSSVTSIIEKIEKLGSGFFSGATAVISGGNVLNGYEIKITGASLSIAVTMNYDDTGIDESTVKPYKFDGTNWVAITPYTQNTTANTISYTISAAATPYALFGSPTSVVTTTTVNAGSGGGGGGSTTTNTPTVTTTLTEAQKVFDTNTDNRIDVLDFNALIVHWGEKGANVIADFDGNGTVDVFDFNLLMVHWIA